MAELSLPAGLDFSKKIPALPDDVRSTLMSVQPTNGQVFRSGGIITIDLPSRAGLFIDPKSIFFRYKMNYTSGATAPIIRCTPAYSSILKLDEFVGSQPVNSVWNYHQVANMYINSHMSVADKAGMASALGYATVAGTTLEQLDSLTLSASQASLAGAVSFSAPLVCSAFSSCDHYIPTGLIAPIRMQFTVAPISDVVSVSANLTDFTLSYFEVCFNAIDMGVAIENLVASAGPKLYLRTTCWANQGQNISASASAGTYSLPFNHRYRSVENLYMLSSGGSSTIDVNAWGDSRDITSGGTVQFVVGQTQYPLLPIDMGNNKPGSLMYLRECTGAINDYRNSMSINTVEFAYGSSASNTTEVAPAKVYISVPLSRIQGFNPYAPSSLLSGVDTSSTPILAMLRLANATQAQNTNVYLVAEYTSLIEIDPLTKQINVIQ
jgi:hypothetical protein